MTVFLRTQEFQHENQCSLWVNWESWSPKWVWKVWISGVCFPYIFRRQILFFWFWAIVAFEQKEKSRITNDLLWKVNEKEKKYLKIPSEWLIQFLGLLCWCFFDYVNSFCSIRTKSLHLSVRFNYLLSKRSPAVRASGQSLIFIKQREYRIPATHLGAQLVQ